jgi:uncharacterized FAD-dependent dehydrogenase
MVDFSVEKDNIVLIRTSDGEEIVADAYILATGHSARDVFKLLHNKNVLIEAKPFALGVRVEHPQSLIDSIQYNCSNRATFYLLHLIAWFSRWKIKVYFLSVCARWHHCPRQY